MVAEHGQVQVTSNRTRQRPAVRLRTVVVDKLAAVAPHTAVSRTVVNPMVAATTSNRWMQDHSAEQNSSAVCI